MLLTQNFGTEADEVESDVSDSYPLLRRYLSRLGHTSPDDPQTLRAVSQYIRKSLEEAGHIYIENIASGDREKERLEVFLTIVDAEHSAKPPSSTSNAKTDPKVNNFHSPPPAHH